jgi:hypothetical protein
MLKRIRRWYEGEGKIREFDNSPDSSIFVMPLMYTEWHWSAKIARVLVAFYLRNWQWLWGTSIALLSLYVAFLALK